MLAVLVAGLWLSTRARAPGPPSPEVTTGAAAGPTSAEPEAPPTRPRPAPAPPVSASAPPGCPEDDADPVELVRPSVWDLLRTRTEELRDRLPQLSRDASPGLRSGLDGLNGEDPIGAVDRIRAAPDRDRDGFDIAVAAALHLGMRALARNDDEDAQRWARQATRDGDQDPLTHALAALALSSAGAPEEALTEMRRASSFTPEEPALALSLARLEAENGHFREAADAANAYLREASGDARLESWRDRMASRAELTETHAHRAWNGVEVLWPAREVDARRVDELMEIAHDTLFEVGARIGLAPRRHLVVVVYRDLSELRRATCAPSWSGGIFDGVLHLDAATVNGPSWARVVRHESTHAEIALCSGLVPTWLNEGLAQQMEGEPSAGTLASWRRMSGRGYWIPFASLEGELIVIDDPEDAGLAYHQSLAMVLLLERHGGRDALREAFSLVVAGEPSDLLGRLAPRADGRALIALMRERASPPLR